MMARGIVALLAAVVSSAAAGSAPGNLQLQGVPEIPVELKEATAPYLDFRTARFQGWNPAKRSVLITTRFGETQQLHEVLQPGGARTQITFQRDTVAAGAYDPVRGDVLIGAQDVAGAENFQFYRFQSGTRTLLTDGKSRNTDLAFSRDGKLIGYTSTRRNGRSADLWIMDPRQPSTDRMVRAMDEPGWRFLDFAPDGASAVVQRYSTATDSPLYRLDITSGELKRITPAGTEVGHGGALFAPDDTLYTSTDYGSDAQRLVAVTGTGEFRPVSAQSRWEVESFDVAPDGSFIAYVLNEAGISRLHVLDRRTGRVRRVDIPDGVISGLRIAPWGEIGFSLSATHTPGDVYSIRPQTLELRRWTCSEAGGLDTSRFASPELVSVESFDGVEISGFLYRPDRQRFPGKRPLVMSIHGGPVAQSRPGYLGRDNYLVEQLGIAVFQPNVRGSTGYGKRFVELDDGMHREGALKDLGVFLDMMARDPGVDASRIALSGGSYSGYLVLGGLIEYADRVSAGASQSGISNFVSFLERTGTYRQDLRRAEYGDEREPRMRAYLERISPLGRARQIRDPIFISAGTNDPRVPLSEAEQIVEAVREHGGTAWSLVANDEGHGFTRKANRDYHFWASVMFWQETLLSHDSR